MFGIIIFPDYIIQQILNPNKHPLSKSTRGICCYESMVLYYYYFSFVNLMHSQNYQHWCFTIVTLFACFLKISFQFTNQYDLLVPLDAVRESLKTAKKDFTKTEDDLKSLQSVGQIIGEVLRPLDNERCKSRAFPVFRSVFMYTVYRLHSQFFSLTIKECISVLVVPFSLVTRNENTADNL